MRQQGYRRWLGALRALLAAVLVLGAGLATAEPVPRKVLAIYDSVHEPLSSETVVHYRAEMPLNHLGYIVDYHDVREPLPAPETMDRYVAVLTWFTYQLENPQDYVDWAARVAERGVRFIMLGTVGVPTAGRTLAQLNRVMARIGVRYSERYVDFTIGASIVTRDDEMIGYERPLDPVLDPFPIIERISPQARVALEVQAPPRQDEAKSALVTTGPGGAFVNGALAGYYDESLEKTQWLINPFELFRRALGEPFFPVPDTTTVSGRRLYFSHVDGDGWNNYVEMERYRHPPTTAAEVMLHELIAPYPDLPVSVGLVAGDIDPVLGGGERAADIARQIYALPQVEVASHTHTHPFEWGFYRGYSRAEEISLLPAPDPQPSGVIGGFLVALGFLRRPTEQELLVERYTSGSRALPRAYLRRPFTVEREVDRAVQITEALSPPGKSLALYQWSGDTVPFEAVIRATRRAGLRNINGGDSRFDNEYPSVGYVPPLSRIAGGERQIYAVNSNENTYTNHWTEHFHGFLSLRETLDRTERPRRLKGVNVYYHTYSAEKQVSLDAVRTHLDWARDARLAPITASHYAAIADGYFSTKIDRIGAMAWRVGERDGLQTVRFDHADGLAVDMTRSRGVIGATRHAGSLYIALDEAVANAVVALRARDAPAPAPAPAIDRALLQESRWVVWDLQRGACGLAYRTRGYGDGAFTWTGLPQRHYAVEARRGEELVWRETVQVDADGILSAVIDATAIEPVTVRISCASPPDEA